MCIVEHKDIYNGDKEDLKNNIKKRITGMFESILHIVEIIAQDKRTFDVARSKVLGIGNDCIRTLYKDLSVYNVKRVVQDDIVKIKQYDVDNGKC